MLTLSVIPVIVSANRALERICTPTDACIEKCPVLYAGNDVVRIYAVYLFAPYNVVIGTQLPLFVFRQALFQGSVKSSTIANSGLGSGKKPCPGMVYQNAHASFSIFFENIKQRFVNLDIPVRYNHVTHEFVRKNKNLFF